MRGLLLFLILFFQVYEVASSSKRSRITSSVNWKRCRHENDEVEEGEIVEDTEARRRLRSRIDRIKFNFHDSSSHKEVLSYFVHFSKHKVNEIINSGYDIFRHGIWSDLLKLNHLEAIQYILTHHFTSNSFHRDIFEEAILNGSDALAEFLIDNSFDAIKNESIRLISLACEHERYNILNYMAHADFNASGLIRRHSGESQFHRAVYYDNIKLVSVLMEFRDLDIDLFDDGGSTPIHYARSVEMIELLIQHGADPMSYNCAGVSAIDLVATRGNHELVRAFGVNLSRRLTIFLELNSVVKFFTRKIILYINRQNVLEDSFFAADKNEEWYLLGIFQIVFKGESGIDHGGLTSEWMSLLIERFFVARLPEDAASTEPSNVQVAQLDSNSEANIHVANDIVDSGNTFHIDPFEIDSYKGENYYYSPFACIDLENKYYTISSKFTGPAEIYKFVGSVIAKSFLKKIPIKVKLVPSLVKLIMGQALTFEDLKDDDPVMYKSMAKCLEPNFDFKMAQYVLPSDELVPVDSENVRQFLDETALNAMYYRHSHQIDQLILGFRAILNYFSLSSYFSAGEITEILLGEEDIDVNDLKSIIEIRGLVWMGKSDIFWAALDILEPGELIQLVRFVTGINGLPHGGLQELGRNISVFDKSYGLFPTASTCGYFLNIPVTIDSSEQLVEALRTSLTSTPEFIDNGCC